MIRIATALAGTALLLPAAAQAETFNIDDTHTHIIFGVNHFGMSTIFGEFHEFDGSFNLDLENPENSAIEIVIDIASLNTGVPAREEHFLSADFFEAESYPTATFTSTEIEVTGDNTALVTGDLTLKGQTQPVTLDVTLNGMMDDHPLAEGTQAFVGFTATTTLLRSEWDMGAFAPAVADEVDIRIEMEATGPTT